jgi:glutamine synthetase
MASSSTARKRPAARSAALHPVLADLKKSGAGKVKVAVSDIDGILRGKILHIDKFMSAAQPHPAGGFGFCDVVFGWDAHDQCYDNTTVTGWQHGFPDALARLDLSTGRRVPWDANVPFFLGEFVNADGSAYPVCPRQTLKRVLERAHKMGLQPMAGMEFEWRRPTGRFCSRPAPRRSASVLASCPASWPSGRSSTRAAPDTSIRACRTARRTCFSTPGAGAR